MEFLSGYAAAKAPYAVYHVDPPANSQRSTPTRSNSTSGTTHKKRSRIPGHARTNSASTTSSGGGRADNQAPPHSAARLGAVDVDAPGSAEHRNVLRRDHTERERERGRGRKYYEDKLLPVTPRLTTHDVSAGNTSDSPSARTPACASAFFDRRMPQHTTMYPDTGGGGKGPGSGFYRAESVSSVSGATTGSNRTVHSSEQQTGSEASACQSWPFVVRNGRTYFSDPTLAYPLPVDLEELHRQSLKTMLLIQLFGRPICAPAFANRPPARILEVGCGTGFWSMMCFRYYEARGQHANMSFTGIDIVPLPPTPGPRSGATSSASSATAAHVRPDKEMNWRFVQHDLRKRTFPFPDASFDFVFVKDMDIATPTTIQQGVVEEFIRILAPGGTIEIWETDHVVRMLRPHVPSSVATMTTTPASTADAPQGQHPSSSSSDDDDDSDDSDDNGDKAVETADRAAFAMGAYVMTANTPLSTPLNNFLVEYNGWVQRALEARALCAVPCTVIGPLLVQEAEALAGVGSRRLAVPLSEIRWEREVVGGVVTKDGKSYIETTRAAAAGRRDDAGGGLPPVVAPFWGGKALEPAAAALRRTALMTVVGEIQSLEPVLREVNGKSQDEWDAWVGKMMNDLVRENGTSWGECLEVGAWWARKR